MTKPIYSEPFSESVNIVLLGSFNASIFHPEWFRRHGLIGPDTEEAAKVEIVSSQVAEIELGNVQLYCADGKLSASVPSIAASERVLDLMAGILQLLPHTPLKAAGINHETTFKVVSEDHWHRIGHKLAPKEDVWNQLCDSPGMQSLVINAKVREWRFELQENLTVEPLPNFHPKHPAIAVKCNTHFQQTSETRESQERMSDLISDFLDSQWERATCRARRVASAIFDQVPE